jgi:2-polyprenyl-3-methyl-5-hydroxy-6-metoxy-1,4-benzoquinol methylase
MSNISEKKILATCAEIQLSFDLDGFAKQVGMPRDEAAMFFTTAISEAIQTLRMLIGIDLALDSKVLEVGAGLGIASVAMSQFGFFVTAIEPGGIGFEKNQAASRYMSVETNNPILVLPETAEDVEFSQDESFDLIFSNNVLEHVKDLEKAIINLLPLLNESGIMVNSCPNYAFPFEPHFGIPLMPIIPRFTSIFLPGSIRHSGLWKSLNFVTARDIKRILRGTEFSVTFRKGTMAKSFSRLSSDGEFAKRHKLLARIATNKFASGFLIRILTLPKSLATPMDFVISRKSQKTDTRIKTWLTAHYEDERSS